MKICNRDWEQIKSAQQGGRLDKLVQHEDDIEKHREADLALLKRHGIDVLRQMGFDGVVDRLERSGQC